MNEHRVFVLVFDPQDHDSGMLTGRIRPDVRKVEVQGHQNSILGSAGVCDCFVICACEILGSNRMRIKTRTFEDLGCFGRRFSSILNFTQ
jgi:hypothetical protein